MDLWKTAVWIVGSYGVGSIPLGFLLVKLRRGVDVREHGSGNIGASNVGRVMGRRWFFIVLGMDALKGLLPALAAGAASGHGWGSYHLPPAVALCGLAAICGHNFSVFLRFKGGKGVATSLGVFLYVFPVGTAIAFGAWLVCALLSRYISLSSMVAGVALAGSAMLLPKAPFHEGKYLTGFCVLIAVMVILRHHGNIRRLVAGTESKLHWGRQKGADAPNQEADH